MEELGQDAVEADGEQDEGQVRIRKQMEQALTRVHVRVADCETRQLREGLPVVGVGVPVGTDALVDRCQQLRLGGSQDIDHRRLHVHGFRGAQAGGLAHRALRPVRVAIVRRGELADRGRIEVGDLGRLGGRKVLAPRAHHRRSPDARGRGHRSHVTHQRDEGRRRPGTGAFRCDPGDDRDRAGEDRLQHVVHAGQLAAG